MTLGDLIDQLTIENIRLWNLEDQRREYSKGSIEMTEEELKEFLLKISNTNRKRNDLIDKINASLRVLVDKAAHQESSYVLTADDLLGSGKNKFYKEEDR